MADWLIVDAANMVWRSFYSHGGREPLPSALLAIHSAQSIARELDTPHVVWAFDRPPYRRREVDQQYKSSPRASQLDPELADDLRREIDRLRTHYLPAMGVGCLSAKGFEADDVMARAVEALPDGDRAILVSGDEDLYQLLSMQCAIYHPVSKRFVTAKQLREQYKIAPDQWRRVKAIAGCKTDDVPGLDGVAEKLAASYLAGKMNPLVVTSAKIRNFMATERFARNLRLVTLPFDDCPAMNLEAQANGQTWTQLCHALDMHRLAAAHSDNEFARMYDDPS